MTRRPAPRTEVIVARWVAVEGPKLCAECGHEHWGWKLECDASFAATDRPAALATKLAPQWGYCSPACNCATLVVDDEIDDGPLSVAAVDGDQQ